MLKVVFFGTPDFSVPTLEVLHHHPEVELVKIISMPDRKAGRGQKINSPAVIEFCKQNKISYLQTENINKESEFTEFCQKEKVDLFVVLAFAQFLGQNLLNTPKIGCFNIHTSLLPKFRGAAPIQHAIINQEKMTGVTIQKMVKKMDAGDVCYSQEVLISPSETGGSLYTKLKFWAALCCSHFIQQVISNELSFEKQDESQVSFAPTLKRTDGRLDFTSNSSKTIQAQTRALSPWPGTFCFLNKKRLKILKATLSNKSLSPGELHTSEGTLLIGCKSGSIRLNKVQLEGKKATTDRELLNGIHQEFTLE